MADENKKGITVKIDAALHAQVKEYIESRGMTMAEFITAACDDLLHPKITEKEDKKIQQSKEKVISMRTWNDEIPKLLDEQPSAQINSCRTFFVNPTGDMRQNDYLVDVVVNYLATGRISSATLEHVISYEKPVLKTHLKVETEPGSCQFVDRTFDLVQEARKQGDLPLLEKLLRYQQAEE